MVDFGKKTRLIHGVCGCGLIIDLIVKLSTYIRTYAFTFFIAGMPLHHIAKHISAIKVHKFLYETYFIHNFSAYNGI